jgi:hypothetical protein
LNSNELLIIQNPYCFEPLAKLHDWTFWLQKLPETIYKAHEDFMPQAAKLRRIKPLRTNINGLISSPAQGSCGMLTCTQHKPIKKKEEGGIDADDHAK